MGVLSHHHLLWTQKKWSVPPFAKLREHRNAILELDREIHDELHAKFLATEVPMPLPPEWMCNLLYSALEEALNPLEALDNMIEYLGPTYYDEHRRRKKRLVTEIERGKIVHLRQCLKDQREFLRSKNITA